MPQRVGQVLWSLIHSAIRGGLNREQTFALSDLYIQKAELMDITRKSIAEIAAYLVFTSQSYFQKVFKKLYGITLGESRKHK